MTITVSWAHAFGGSPAEDNLLRLVPANAEIVAGIQDPHHGDQSGRLLIVTHSNKVDLNDWITLAGVDDQREVDRLIEVAMSSRHDGDLSEHLLLLRGSFNSVRILQAAERSGGVIGDYTGVRIVVLKPFAREQREMPDTRWLAIVDDRTAVFGTPAIVKSALDRYRSSAAVDNELVKRLAELKADVNCWSVLTMPGAMLARHLRAGVVDASSDTLLRGISGVAVGVHYGSKDRVDFAISTDSPEAATALATAFGGQFHLLPIADTLRTRFAGVSVERNEVRGSVRVKDKEFDEWGLAAVYARLAAVYARLAAGSASGGENVARASAR